MLPSPGRVPFPLPITAVVAVTPSWGIGYRNTVPWVVQDKHLKQDMAYFRQCTTQTEDSSKMNAVVMGRVTWESIPLARRPLQSRINVVVTSSSVEKIHPSPASHLHVVQSFEEALDLLSAPPLKDTVEKVVVIGGAKLFEESLFHPSFHTLHLTQIISQDFPCDTFLTEKTCEYLKAQDLDASVVRERVEEADVVYR